MRRRAADRAGLRLDRLVGQSAPVEDAAVRLVHALVGRVEAAGTVHGHVKRVGVLHDELAAAQHAESRPRLVAELRLDLVEVQRQLAVRLDRGRQCLGDDLFVGRRQRVAVPAAVRQREQVVSVGDVAAGAGKELDGLQGGHEHLHRARRVHFLPDDLDRLVQRPPAQRQVRVQPRRELPDEP